MHAAFYYLELMISRRPVEVLVNDVPWFEDLCLSRLFPAAAPASRDGSNRLEVRNWRSASARPEDQSVVARIAAFAKGQRSFDGSSRTLAELRLRDEPALPTSRMPAAHRAGAG